MKRIKVRFRNLASLFPTRRAAHVALLLLALIGLTSCIRAGYVVVVHDKDVVSVSGRVTINPLFTMFEGVESYADSFRRSLDPSLSPQIDYVSDSDGWQGFAFEYSGRHDAVFSHAFSAVQVEQLAEGWQFVFDEPEPFSLFGALPSLDVGPFGYAPDEGLRFVFVVALPGKLDNTNSQDSWEQDGFTFARWELNEPDQSIYFRLVTDTSPSEGLSGGAVAGIAAGSIAVVVIGGRLLARRFV